MSELAYTGLRVLDMSQGVAGPSCGAILAQQGADVIKVEPPEGDWIRVMGGGRDGLTALAVVHNLGKRSVCVDARKPEGRALVARLAAKADVMIENFRPGVMARLGLDDQTLRAANPGLVYLSVTGFGDAGPWAQKPGTDSVMQAFTGMAWLNREDGGKPKRMGMLVPDTVTGLYGVQAVGAALFARTRTGAGRHVRISLAECCAAFQSAPIVDDAMFAGQAKPPVAVPSGVFATADGYLSMITLRSDMWERFCRAIGKPDWLADPRYATNASRGAHAAEINRAVAEIFAGADTRHWIDLLEAADVLCARIQDFEQFRAHPQTRAMGWIGALEQAPYGALPMPRLPGSGGGGGAPCSEADPGDGHAARSKAPRAGEHTREVLAEFGVDPQTLARLESEQIVVQGA